MNEEIELSQKTLERWQEVNWHDVSYQDVVDLGYLLSVNRKALMSQKETKLSAGAFSMSLLIINSMMLLGLLINASLGAMSIGFVICSLVLWVYYVIKRKFEAKIVEKSTKAVEDYVADISRRHPFSEQWVNRLEAASGGST